MKRLTTVLFVIASLILLAPIPARADMKGKCGKNLQWVLDDDGKLTITGSGRMDDFSKSSQPWRAALVHSVILPEGLTYIGNNAFRGSRIYTISLPSTLTGIGKAAFAKCKRMTNIILPLQLENIGSDAFIACESLIEINIPISVRKIGAKAFAECKSLISIGINTQSGSIGMDAFAGCSSLSNITSLPEFITEGICSLYGLPEDLVSQYVKNNSSNKTETYITSQQSKEVIEIPPYPVVPSKPIKDIANNSTKKDSESKKINRSKIKYGDSDIDKKIPETKSVNPHTFVFIFANENYDMMPNVPFAINDGKSFATYCQTTLGIPESNLNIFYDASLGNMRAAIKYLQQVDEAFKGEISVIFYYAGHGAPDMKTVEPYLVPTDAYAIDETACYPLETLYKQLGELQAKSVKVFIDACFSGADRNNDMLAQGGRLVATVPKKAGLTGNVVVISATSNEQAAWQYAEQGHGLFTYCLIKKLQETKGNVSMGDLNDYLIEKVSQISIVKNRVAQTPTSQSSSKLGNRWRQWQLNN